MLAFFLGTLSISQKTVFNVHQKRSQAGMPKSTSLLLPKPKLLTNKNTIAEAKKSDLLSMFKYMPAVDKAYYKAVFRKS